MPETAAVPAADGELLKKRSNTDDHVHASGRSVPGERSTCRSTASSGSPWPSIYVRVFPRQRPEDLPTNKHNSTVLGVDDRCRDGMMTLWDLSDRLFVFSRQTPPVSTDAVAQRGVSEQTTRIICPLACLDIKSCVWAHPSSGVHQTKPTTGVQSLHPPTDTSAPQKIAQVATTVSLVLAHALGWGAQK